MKFVETYFIKDKVQKQLEPNYKVHLKWIKMRPPLNLWQLKLHFLQLLLMSFKSLMVDKESLMQSLILLQTVKYCDIIYLNLFNTSLPLSKTFMVERKSKWKCTGSFLLRNLFTVFVLYHCGCWFTVGFVIQNKVLC